MSGLFGEDIKRPKVKSVEWYTPGWIFGLLAIDFDLDPCHPWDHPTAVPAAHRYTIKDNGLTKRWEGRVWMNPPYGRETPKWVSRFIDHGNGIALLFSRTDAAWCQAMMKHCDAVLFLSGRVEFIPGRENKHKKSRSGAGSVMFAMGEDNVQALRKLEEYGTLFIAGQASHHPA